MKSRGLTANVQATIAEKITVLIWYHSHGENQSLTARHFSKVFPHLRMTQPLVSAWVESEGSMRKQGGDKHPSMKRGREIQYPEIKKDLGDWVSQAILAGVITDGDVIREKWKEFARLHQVASSECLKLSNGWLGRFKKRHGLRASVRHGEGAAADPQTIAAEVARVLEINQEFALKNIVNMDETGLLYACVSCSESFFSLMLAHIFLV